MSETCQQLLVYNMSVILPPKQVIALSASTSARQNYILLPALSHLPYWKCNFQMNHHVRL